MAQRSPQFRFQLIVDTVIDPDARLQVQLFQTRCWDIALDAFTPCMKQHCSVYTRDHMAPNLSPKYLRGGNLQKSIECLVGSRYVLVSQMS
jgi:hypothetical protein